MNAVDIEALQQWVGRTETRTDVITTAPVAALSASLDRTGPRGTVGDTLPACWHWLYFQEAAATSSLGSDGHVRRGGFIPPVPLSHRMWAGGRLRFDSPLIVGEAVRRISTVADVQCKQGRSGELVFVTLRHQVFQQATLAIEEEQDLVFRDRQTGDGRSAPPTAPKQAQWSREVLPDPVLLFRYSALTFNSHRIHYDRDYATGEEGYSSLVVQGPLTATLLLDLLNREIPDTRVAGFEFRALGALLEGEPMTLQGYRNGQQARLWALDGAGSVAMEASAQLVGN